MTPSHERCAVRRDELSAYHDRALDRATAAALAEHVGRCPDCQERLAKLGEVDRAIAALPAPEMSLAEREELVARLAALRRSAAREEKQRSWWRGSPPRLLAPLAAAALLLVIVLRVDDVERSTPARVREVAPAPAEAPAPPELAPTVESPPSSKPMHARGREESAAHPSEFDQRKDAPDAKAAKTLDEAQGKRELAPQMYELETKSMEKGEGEIGAQVAPENAAGAQAGEPADAMAEQPASAAARDQASAVAEPSPPPAPPAMTFSKERGTSGGTKLQESAPAGMPAPPPAHAPAPARASDFRLATPGSAIDVVKNYLIAGDLAGARVALERIHVGALPESLAVEAAHAGFDLAGRSAEVDDCARASAIADTVLGRFPAAATADSLRAARAHMPCAPR